MIPDPVLRPVAEESGRREQHGQNGQREHEIGEAHEQVVRPARVVTRDHADRGADDHGQDSDDEGDPHRGPDPVEHAAEVVAPEEVGAEDMTAAKRRRDLEVVHVVPVEPVGRNPRRCHPRRR